MLSFAHGLHVTARAQQKHVWVRSSRFMESAFELRGKTLGVIGYGSIGRETARIAQALGMTVLALKRDPAVRIDTGWSPAGVGDPQGLIPGRFFGPAERRELLAQSDFVAVMLPLTADTRGFIGAGEIEAMKPNAYVVNVGRGEVIDQQALIEALRSGAIAGGGLDVFDREPLDPESPLWDMENVILTPHMSGAHQGYVSGACELFEENLRRFTSGRPLLNQVNRHLGY
jgi:phosphoglycerate dehydrogenase-like enzyme